MALYKVKNLTQFERRTAVIKANLSWTRKKSNSSDVKIFLSVFVSFFFELKAELQVLKFEFYQVKLR